MRIAATSAMKALQGRGIAVASWYLTMNAQVDYLDTETSVRNSMKPLRKMNAVILLPLFDYCRSEPT